MIAIARLHNYCIDERLASTNTTILLVVGLRIDVMVM
jgi:hypothetical protein